MTDPLNLPDQTIAQLSERIKRCELASRSLTEAILARIAALNPRLNAFITVTKDLTLAQAEQADLEIRRGELRVPSTAFPWRLKTCSKQPALSPQVEQASGVKISQPEMPGWSNACARRGQ